jgi:hypothetical protein
VLCVDDVIEAKRENHRLCWFETNRSMMFDIEKCYRELGKVAQSCNPSYYLGGGDQEDSGSRPAQAKSL